MVKQKIIDNCDAIRSISKITGWMEFEALLKILNPNLVLLEFMMI